MILENIFPTPIALFRYENTFDRDFIDKQEQRNNIGNITSSNRYILKHKKLLDIRQFIEKSLYEYFMATYNPKNDVRLKITQSWVNWTNKGQYHHKHAHPNSLISGCFYVNADKNTDKIYFYRGGYQRISFPPIDWNLYNSESWWFPVGTNDLILFPSSLTHMVETVDNDDTRISLAFNSFPIGNIGDEEELTALRLEN